MVFHTSPAGVWRLPELHARLLAVEAHEIKGSAFVTLERWLTRHVESERLDAFWRSLGADAANVRGAAASQWFPEGLHQEVLRALDETIAGGDVVRFDEIIHECTLAGVHAFANIILAMSSPAFVLRRTPTLWGVLRRGPATLTVDQDRGSSRLHYRAFPYMGDARYRYYFKALLAALVKPSLGRRPDVVLLDHGHDWLDVEVRHG